MDIKKIVSSSLLLLAVSCAHHEPFVEKETTFKVDPKKDLGLVQSNIKEQVAEALKLGGRAPEFLATDLFIKGNDASMRGDFQIAVQLFKYVVTLAPNDHFVQKKLAIELIRQGELKEAETILAGLFSQKNSDESVGLILAGVYTALEKPSFAKDIYKKLISNFNSEEACLYLAKSYTVDKKFNDAHKILIQCEKKNPDEPSFAFYRGKIESERGNLTVAKSFFNHSLKIDKTYYQAALALGALYEEKEDSKGAINEYKKFLAFDGNSSNVPVLTKLVNLMLTGEANNEEVLEHLENLVSQEPNDLNLKVRLGLVYSETGRYESALKIFKDVLEVVPESDKIQYYLGALEQQVNNFDSAKVFYSKILPSSPLYSDASVQLAQLMSMSAKEDFVNGKKEQIEIFHKFIEQRIKEHEEIALELKMVEAGFFDDTLQFKKAIESLIAFKANKNFTDSHSYYLASIMEKDGQFSEARKLIFNILDKDPNNPHALNFLGYSYLEKNENMDKAYEYISKAVKLKPEDGYIRDSLAWYYYSVGKYSDALREAKKAFELVGTDVIISKHLAKIYESLKNYEKAKEFYAEALKNAKAQNERDEVLKQIKELEQQRLPASQMD